MMGYLFALFVNAGIIKSLFGEYLILDLTVLSFSTMLFLLALQILIGQRRLRNIFDKNIGLILFFVLLFAILIICSSLYTISPEFWENKLFKVLFLTIPSFLIPALFFNFKDIKKFIVGTIFIYCAIILQFTYLYSIYGSNLLYMGKEIGTHYLIWGSFFAGTGLLFIGLLQEKIMFGNHEKYRTKTTYKLTILVLFTFFILFVTGAKGPIIFFTICFIFMSAQRVTRKKLLLQILGVALIIILIIPLSKNINLGRSERIVGFFTNSDQFYSAISLRADRFSKSWSLIRERPILGYGIGSYSYATYGDDKRDYPHNLLLEIWFENGFIPFLLFCLFLFLIMYMAIKKIDKQFVRSFLWVNIYFILSYMKSSSLTDARVLFAYLGILFAATWCSRSKSDIAGCYKNLPLIEEKQYDN